MSRESPGDGLIVGKEAVVADRRPATKRPAPRPAGRLNHGLQGPHVKPEPGISTEVGEKARLRNAWVSFLRPIRFQWFATFTFETNVHPEAALKRFRRFTNDLNKHLFGRRWRKRQDGGVYWIVAIERHKSGVVHMHALLGATDDLNKIARRLSWMDHWQSMAGFARIEAVNKDDAAIRYVTKYVTKDGEIEFSENLSMSREYVPSGPAE